MFCFFVFFHSQSRGGGIDLWDFTLCKTLTHKIDDPGFCKLATFDHSEFIIIFKNKQTSFSDSTDRQF